MASDTIHQKDKKWEVIAEDTVCSEGIVLKHIIGKLSGWKTGRKKIHMQQREPHL